MEIKLRNTYNGKLRKVKTNRAIYILLAIIPFLNIVAIIMTIVRKQFKMSYLNLFVLNLIFALIFRLIIVIFTAINFSYTNDIYLLFFMLIYFIQIIYFSLLIFNLNKWTLKWYLANGYEILNEEEIQDIEIIKTEAQDSKYPFWLMFK